jgi:XapX domain-containing protein
MTTRLPPSPTRRNSMTYLASTAAGVLVGAVYALIRTAAPAPPPSALLGLLGMFAAQSALLTLR